MAVRYDADVCGRAALALVVCFCIAGCDQKDPDVPDPGPEEIRVSPGDRLGWTQPAPDSSDIASLQFALYVDGTRSTLAGAACANAGGSYNCSAVLPALTAGSHTLELAAFVGDGGSTAESARSAALRVVAVTVARTGAVFSSAPIPVVTVDQARLTLSPFVEGLSLPSDVACAHDGSIFVAERGGRVRLIRNGLLYPEPVLDLSAEVIAPQGGLVAIALDPEFEKSGFMFVLYAAAAPRQGQEFMLARFRGVKDAYGERAVLLDRTPASDYGASGALRIGPDGKLYLALDSSSDTGIASSFASYNGKVLRLNMDATTPDDRAAQTPIFSFDHPQPLAMDWQPGSGNLWVVDRLGTDAGRLSAVGDSFRQSRALFRTSYALPAGLGASSAVFYRGDLMPMFRGNLFVAAETGQEMMRLRFDPENASRIVSVEHLLKDQIGPIRVVSEGNDGALFIATERALYRLAP